MLRVNEIEISLHNSSGGLEYLRTLEKHCWQCSVNGRSQNNLSYTTKKMSHVRATITKNASLEAIARYISITTIFTEDYLQVFNAGNFFSCKNCHDL